MRPIDLTGRRFGKLTVLEFSHRVKQYKHWKVRCDCGRETTMRGTSLTSENSTSCGCVHTGNKRAQRHGHTGQGLTSPTYESWKAMKARCYNPTNDSWEYYGGRGITVCSRWMENFENFLEDMGERPAGTTLDRKDNNWHYEPGNCQWSTPFQQRHNSRPKSR
jgi:hypothetical protein